MKFLAFVDLHQDKKVLQELVLRAKKDDIDFIVCAGDLSDFGRGFREALESFNSLGKKAYFIPGNHEEGLEQWEKLVSKYPAWEVLHNKSLTIGNYVFLGYGGGGFAQRDPQFRKIARQWYDEHQGKKIILVTHGPPYGTKIDLINERQVGNIDYRKFIERIKPKVAICGHLHDNAGATDAIGETKIIHPGWEGMVIELK